MVDELMGEVARILEAVEVGGVRFWAYFWGWEADEELHGDKVLDGWLSAGFPLECGAHSQHEFDIAFRPTHIVLENIAGYLDSEMRLVADVVSKAVGSPVVAIPLEWFDGEFNLVGEPAVCQQRIRYWSILEAAEAATSQRARGTECHVVECSGRTGGPRHWHVVEA